jgi:predicted AAA+ superfamily ATPase
MSPILKARFDAFRSVYLHGPRQAGKTTLCRLTFPDMPYASLENPDVRAYAHEDPRGFLARFPNGAILDEIQKEPALLSYLQEIIDSGSGKFVLTGSQNLLLMEGVTQSLAGRIAVLQLMPMSLSEIHGREASDPVHGKFTGDKLKPERLDVWREIFLGGFPEPRTNPEIIKPWADAYIATYLERDVRSLLKIHDLALFQRFMVLCAARSGQLLNIASLASDSGVSESQCRRWLNLLQASELVFLLSPYHANLGKRLVKSPKLFFTDTGLLCRLLAIDSPQTLSRHPSLGALFETFVVNEIRKSLLHRGERPSEYFWRDKTGHEVNYLLAEGSPIIAFECKAAQTLAGGHLKNLISYRNLNGTEKTRANLVHGGDGEGVRQGINLLPWWRM